jgi:hypothetical protein
VVKSNDADTLFPVRLLLGCGLYRIAQAALNLPSGKTVVAINNIHGKRDTAKRLQDMLLPLARLFSKLFPMSEYRQKRLQADFSRSILNRPRRTLLGRLWQNHCCLLSLASYLSRWVFRGLRS